jgi:hypothetical protein
MLGQDPSAGLLVIAGVQVHHWLGGQRTDRPDGVQGGRQQPVVATVGRGGQHRQGEPQRAGAALFRPLRQVIESINQAFKGQLDLERHGGHTPPGVLVRVLQRILALTAVIWHNHHTGQPTPRSLVAYDH